MNNIVEPSNTTCLYNLTEEQQIFYEMFSWWIDGILSLCITFTGIIVNIIATLVMLKSELVVCFFYWLLICHQFFDGCFLFCCALDVFRKYIAISSLHNYIFVVFLFPFRSIVKMCSIYITIALAGKIQRTC